MQQQHKSNHSVTLPQGSHSHLGQPLEIRYGCVHNTGANSHHTCQLAMKWQAGDDMWAEDERWRSTLDTYVSLSISVCVCVYECGGGGSCYFENMGLPLHSPLIYCGLRLWTGCTCAHSDWNTPTHMVTHVHTQTNSGFFPSHSPVLSYSLSQTFLIHLLF